MYGSSQSRGETIIPFDPEFNPTLRRMNSLQNPTNLCDGINLHLPPLVDALNQVDEENRANDALRMKPPIPRPTDLHWGNVNITHSDRPLVLPTLPQGNTFVVTVA